MNSIEYIQAKTLNKYNVLLKLLNRILVNIGRQEINDIIEFKNVDRKDLLKEENNKIIEEMEEEIHKYYCKYNLKYGHKSQIKHYILTLIKAMCEDIYFQFKSKSVKVKKNNKVLVNAIYDIILQDE